MYFIFQNWESNSLSQIKSNADHPLFLDSIPSGLKDRVLYSRHDHELNDPHPYAIWNEDQTSHDQIKIPDWWIYPLLSNQSNPYSNREIPIPNMCDLILIHSEHESHKETIQMQPSIHQEMIWVACAKWPNLPCISPRHFLRPIEN